MASRSSSIVEATTANHVLTYNGGYLLPNPTGLPKIIPPPAGSPPQPLNTTLVQIGFFNALNYPFVSTNSLVQRQIFTYIPRGIIFGMTLDELGFVMHSLRAYNTTGSSGYATTDSSVYTTTLACFYLRSSDVGSLQSQLDIKKTRNASLPLYDNPDPSIQSIMALINPAIPLTPVAVLDSSTTPASTSTSVPTSVTAPTPTMKTSFDRLSSSKKISMGVMVPVAIIAIFLLGLLFWRRRKASLHNADKIERTAEEKDTDSKIHEMAASTRRFELQAGEYEHELPAADRELRELQGDSRRRQELRGLESAQELDAGAGD